MTTTPSGDRMNLLIVEIGIDADPGARRYPNVLVDDGSPDHGAPADDHVVHDDRVLDDRPGFDEHAGEEDRPAGGSRRKR